MGELDINILKEIGKFTHNLRRKISTIPKTGSSMTELIDFVESEIFKAGYMPAFPCGVSINEIAAHYTVFDEDIVFKKGDVLKIDFGVAHEGYLTDNAITIEIEDNKYEKMLQANLEALNKAVELIEVGTTMSSIGKAVNEIAKTHGFNTIHNLSGHQISRNDLHCGLSVPNYENFNNNKVKENCEFAIEPFFTAGEPRIKSIGASNHMHLVKDKPIRDPIAKKVLIYIKENFPELPFSKRWLLKDVITKINPNIKSKDKGFDVRKVNYAVKILKDHGILYEYDCLVSTDGSIITQFEDSVVFDKDKKIVLTRL